MPVNNVRGAQTLAFIWQLARDKQHTCAKDSDLWMTTERAGRVSVHRDFLLAALRESATVHDFFEAQLGPTRPAIPSKTREAAQEPAGLPGAAAAVGEGGHGGGRVDAAFEARPGG